MKQKWVDKTRTKKGQQNKNNETRTMSQKGSRNQEQWGERVDKAKKVDETSTMKKRGR